MDRRLGGRHALVTTPRVDSDARSRRNWPRTDARSPSAHVRLVRGSGGGIPAQRQVDDSAESFFATLKKELINRRVWPSKAELRTEVFDYIETFYNRQRRHSTLGQLSPVDYENSTLISDGAEDAASRLAPMTRPA